ncbi:MAG: hypothetical protein WC449_05765 [Candidatus Paceibacterota bacterium]
MPNPKTQSVHIRFDLVNRMQKLRAELSTADNRLKLRDLVNEAIEQYLEKKDVR